MNFPLDAQHDSLENVLRCVQTYRRYCNSNSLYSFEMVLLVASRGPTVPVQIAKALDISEASASVGLDHLGAGSPKFGRTLGEPPDLLSKINHPVDARMKLAALTEKGNQLVAEMRAPSASIEATALIAKRMSPVSFTISAMFGRTTISRYSRGVIGAVPQERRRRRTCSRRSLEQACGGWLGGEALDANAS